MNKSLHFLDPTFFPCTNESDPMKGPFSVESPMAPPEPHLLTVSPRLTRQGAEGAGSVDQSVGEDALG